MFRKLFLVLFALIISCPSVQAFEQEKKTEVIYFGATWCGPCRAMKSMMKDKEVQAAIKKVDFKMYDVDIRRKESEKWGVRQIPTILVIKGGKVKRYTGYKSKEDFLKIIGK